MAEDRIDPIEPREPEIEYTSRGGWDDDGFYRTGSTTPPPDYLSMMAVVLVLVIFFGGIISALGILNIRLFAAAAETEEVSSPVTFTAGANTTVPDSLEQTQPQETEETTLPLHASGGLLQIQDSPASQENVPEEGALSWQQVYEKLIDSVVSITCTGSAGTSSGTGVIMTDDGYVITNCHVVEEAQSICVLLTDGRTFAADVIGQDSVSDLAVLHIGAADLTPAEFGNSSALRVGDAVVAIGDPLGVELRGTMTDGIISAINRDLKVGGRTMSLLQTTAALNAGNSGGPLVNCYGQVVGINTMKIGDSASYAGVEGLGFAIPISTVADVVEQLITQGYVAGRPSLGMEGQMVSSFYQYYYRLPAGWLVTEVAADSGAAAAGLQTGDIVLYANDVRITDSDTLSQIVNDTQVGDSLPVVIYRAGQEYSASITIVEAKS